MSAGSDVWGYITGVISILALICQLVRMNLPSSKLKKFDSLLHETEDLLQETEEEGLLRGGDFVHQTNESLGRLREAAQPLRSRVHKAKTISQQCLGIITGLSSRLSVLCSELKKLKAEIATTTDEAREVIRQLRLEEERWRTFVWQDDERFALTIQPLDAEKASNASNGRDAYLPEDQGSSDNEKEGMALMGAENDMASRAGNQTLTHNDDIIQTVIETVEEAYNTTVASDVFYPPNRIGTNTVSSRTL